MKALTLRNLLTFQGTIAALGVGLVTWVGGVQPGASYGIGAGLMLANLFFLSWVWNRLIDKKAIAWTAVLIVIKYTVLLGAIFLLSQKAWFHVLSAGLGMVTLIGTSLAQVAFTHRE
jgi:hypothetical protein